MVEEKQKQEQKMEEKKEQIDLKSKTEEKKEKKQEVKKIKKDEVSVKGFNLSISPKESFSFCNMIRGRNIDKAIKMTEEVLQYRRVVKMNNLEVPHQHGKGIMAGRFPQNAAKEFLKMLKSLRANAVNHELELEKAVIFCKADFASKPYRRGGTRFKRTNVIMKLEKKKENKFKHLKGKSAAGKP